MAVICCKVKTFKHLWNWIPDAKDFEIFHSSKLDEVSE